MRQFIQDLTTQMRGIWARLEGPQRLVVSAVFLATLVGLGGIVWFAGQPSYEVVYSAQSGDETARVQQALQKSGLSWQLDDSGMRVLVERGRVGAARAAIAGEGLMGRSEVTLDSSNSFIEDAAASMPEMEAIRPLLERSHRGLLFDDATGEAVKPLMRELFEATGLRRLSLFWEVLDVLANAPEPEVLASLSYELDLEALSESGVNRAIAYLRENLTENIDEKDLAELVNQSQSAFSRAFKRHTGSTLVRYKNQLRVDLACQMLLTRPEAKVAEICYEVGFSNLSNFNRHFLRLKGMSPSQFRATFAANGVFSETG